MGTIFSTHAQRGIEPNIGYC
ncbi:hypothetical protein EMIT043CA1_150070 [Pseudomonas brassicacearum]